MSERTPRLAASAPQLLSALREVVRLFDPGAAIPQVVAARVLLETVDSGAAAREARQRRRVREAVAAFRVGDQGRVEALLAEGDGDGATK